MKKLLLIPLVVLRQRRKILAILLVIVLFPIHTCSVPSGAQSTIRTVAFLDFKPAIPLSVMDESTTSDAVTETTSQPIQTAAGREDDQATIGFGNDEIPYIESNGAENLENTTPQGIEVSTPDSIKITLSFVGDCTIGDDEKYTWNTFDEVYKKVKDPSYFFQGVKSIFAYDDFTLINFEGTFTKATKKAVKQYRFKGDPSYIDILLKGSIEGVTLANNHSLDYLEKGFEDTVQTLNKAQIAYTYFDTYFVKNIKGLKIGFLGYKGWEHEKKSNDLLVKHVKELREQGVNYIVASYHWGDQNSYKPNALQKRMAHFAIDNGVDLVIGHHPHVLQGLEVYKNKNIVYSLGNFCFGGAPNPKDKDTIIYQHVIVFDDQKQSIIDTEYKIIPARVSAENGRNNYQPIIVSGEEEKRILDKYNTISQGLSKK